VASTEPGGRRIEDGTLSIAVRDEGSERVIELFGELDAACVDTFREQVQAGLADRSSSVVIDLSGLEFIDSVGIEVIYRASEESRANGSVLRLIRGSPNVERTFSLMGLDQSLPFVD
jgi:anti-sigma B factor antagonist